MDDVMGKLGLMQDEIARLHSLLAAERADADRIVKREKTTRWLALGALLLGVAGPLAARWLPITFRTVRARELVVRDENGKPRVQLLSNKDFASIIINGDDGNPAIAMKVDTFENVLYVASRSPKPSTGIRLESSADFSTLTLHHRQASEGKDSLSGWLQVQSSFQDEATISVHAADGGYTQLAGSGIQGQGPSLGLWPGTPKDQKSSWLKIDSTGGRPFVEIVEMGGISARLDIANGPRLHLTGPFGGRTSATFGVHDGDKGGSMMLVGEQDTSVFAYTGAQAGVSVANGTDDENAWSTPLPKPKTDKKK